ncbi:MAG: glycine cleavage system protein H [Candidatus Nanoarchaeia archaeon]|nr:glycine cleavage system protein H [Candidatus Nanoarchaeia archaeon]
MEFPKNLLYSKDYLWVELKKDEAIIGIIELACKKSKEFAFINLPKKGDKIKIGDKLIDLEAVKWTGNLKSPVTGEVIEINSNAYNEPVIINSKPYNIWLVKIKISNKDELKNLLSYEDAIKYYKNME